MSDNGLPKVLVSPSTFSAEALSLLARAGFEPVLNPHGRKLTPEETVALGAGCVGIVAGVEALDAAVLARLPGLRCISRSGSGMDNVDLPRARELGIAVRNTPDGPTAAVAELCLGLILSLLRLIPRADRELRRGEWTKRTGNLLQGKAVGIVGLGRIGRAVAALLAPFSCRILAADPAADHGRLQKRGVRLLPLAELLAEADIVCLHLSPAAGAPPLLGRAELGRMRRPSWLVNLSRGGVVDESALADALRDGPLAGAAVDVFSKEPYTGPLASLENAILTPHLGAYAQESKERMERDAVSQLLEELRRA